MVTSSLEKKKNQKDWGRQVKEPMAAGKSVSKRRGSTRLGRRWTTPVLGLLYIFQAATWRWQEVSSSSLASILYLLLLLLLYISLLVKTWSTSSRRGRRSFHLSYFFIGSADLKVSYTLVCFYDCCLLDCLIYAWTGSSLFSPCFTYLSMFTAFIFFIGVAAW